MAGVLPEGWDADIPIFPADPKGMATRAASGKVLNAIAQKLPSLIGGSADLDPSALRPRPRPASPSSGMAVPSTAATPRRGQRTGFSPSSRKKRPPRPLGSGAEQTERVVDRVPARGEPLPEP